MAIVQNPIIGKASGQSGGFVFQSYNDLKIIRRRPFAPRNPDTQAQQNARSNFGSKQVRFVGDPSYFLYMFAPSRPHTISRHQAFLNQINHVKTLYPFSPGVIPTNRQIGNGKGYTLPFCGWIINPYIAPHTSISLYPFGIDNDFPDWPLYDIFTCFYSFLDNTATFYNFIAPDYAQSFRLYFDDQNIYTSGFIFFTVYRLKSLPNNLFSSKVLVS
jgi:hypothetical protein